MATLGDIGFRGNDYLKSKDVIEWKVNLELDWMWKTVLKLGNVDVGTANGWAVNRNVLVKGMDVLTGLLLVTWLKGRVSETFTAALVLLVTSIEVTAKDLKLIEDLVAGLEANEELAEVVLIGKRWIDTSKLKH